MFSPDAWERFHSFYVAKLSHLIFKCTVCCKSDSNGEELIACDRCLYSFHYHCMKLKKDVKKRKAWFCRSCKNEKKVKESLDTIGDDVTLE